LNRLRWGMRGIRDDIFNGWCVWCRLVTRSMNLSNRYKVY